MKLNDTQKRELFEAMAAKFADRDNKVAKNLIRFVEETLDTTNVDELSVGFVLKFAKAAFDFTTEVGAVLTPVSSSMDWLDYAMSLVHIHIESTKEIRAIALAHGVNPDDVEEIRELCKDARVILKDKLKPEVEEPNFVPGPNSVN